MDIRLNFKFLQGILLGGVAVTNLTAIASLGVSALPANILPQKIKDGWKKDLSSTAGLVMVATAAAAGGWALGAGAQAGLLIIKSRRDLFYINGSPQNYTNGETVAASNDPNTAADSTATFGPFREGIHLDMSGILTDASYDQRKTGTVLIHESFRSNHSILAANADELDRALQEPNHQELDKYRHMLKVVAAIEDPLAKALVINAWVNTALRYTLKIEGNTAVKNTLLESVQKGEGCCDERAQLKFHALSNTGFADDKIRWVGVFCTDYNSQTNAHAVILAKIGGRNYVLDHYSPYERIAGLQVPINDPISNLTIFDSKSRIHDPHDITNIGWDAPFRYGGSKMFPLISMTYNKLATYNNVNYSPTGKPPYYVGPPLKHAFLPPRRAPVSLGQNLERVPEHHRAAVADILIEAGYYDMSPDLVAQINRERICYPHHTTGGMDTGNHRMRTATNNGSAPRL